MIQNVDLHLYETREGEWRVRLKFQHEGTQRTVYCAPDVTICGAMSGALDYLEAMPMGVHDPLG